MDQCIDPAGSRHGSRCGDEEQRIQKCISRDQLIGKYCELVISFVISNNRKSRNL